ncbi:MAG: branched-chain amino acid ABC transporter permease [Proteobacteria bacterium]|nr:branched-chain amino acid ABC transporter permease [Pseudomonadota bacterium]MBU1740525.1 branched-chain amino acid ABC transporter permease [Pseudomonadota bacterium]
MRSGNFKVNYVGDEVLFEGPFVRFWLAVGAILLVILPMITSSSVILVANLICIYVIGAVGLNLLTGFTGQISLGHAGIMGVGGFTCAILVYKLGLPYLLALPASGLMAAAVGILVGVPSLRIKGLYLCIATLAAQVILYHLFGHWKALTYTYTYEVNVGNFIDLTLFGLNLSWPDLTSLVFTEKVSAGISIERLSVLGMNLGTEKRFYYLVIILTVGLVFFARNVVRTRVGRAFVAIRDRDLAAEIIGINLFRYKLTAFAVSSFYAGVAGALMFGLYKNVSDQYFTLSLSIAYVAMIIVGGLGSILGSIFGAVFITLIPQVLQAATASLQPVVPKLTSYLEFAKEIIFGILIVVFLIFEPHGLNAVWGRIKASFNLWPFSY